MTKQERERITAQENTLARMGFEPHEARALRRISNTLRRWHERECGIDGGCIERDDVTGRPYWRSDTGRRWPVADRERGALKRLGKIIADRNTREMVRTGAHSVQVHQIVHYVQTDPRGAALYLLRPGDVPPGADPASYYTRGVCVY